MECSAFSTNRIICSSVKYKDKNKERFNNYIVHDSYIISYKINKNIVIITVLIALPLENNIQMFRQTIIRLQKLIYKSYETGYCN